MYSITRYFTAEDFKEVGKCKKDVYMDWSGEFLYFFKCWYLDKLCEYLKNYLFFKNYCKFYIMYSYLVFMLFIAIIYISKFNIKLNKRFSLVIPSTSPILHIVNTLGCTKILLIALRVHSKEASCHLVFWMGTNSKVHHVF
jgi:hypothetical protein